MNTYRLGIHDASHYAALFDESKVKIQAAFRGQRSRPEVAVVTIGEGDLEFEIWMASDAGRARQAHVLTARSVPSQIVQMDDAARALPDVVDSDENLAWVVTHDDCVEFHYFANTVNSEWSVFFTRDEAGIWRCRGLERPG